jgi:purine-cytosine permease-like protein
MKNVLLFFFSFLNIVLTFMFPGQSCILEVYIAIVIDILQTHQRHKKLVWFFKKEKKRGLLRWFPRLLLGGFLRSGFLLFGRSLFSPTGEQ